MTKSEIIGGLKMTMDLILFDPSTGNICEPDELNDLNRTTYDACKGAIEALKAQDNPDTATSDTISRHAVYSALEVPRFASENERRLAYSLIEQIPSAQTEIIRCKDCKHWRQQTNYQGVPLLFGFCESDDMWRSLHGETYEVSHIDTDNDFYCGYAERRTDE